jgi:hypothetical protein
MAILWGSTFFGSFHSPPRDNGAYEFALSKGAAAYYIIVSLGVLGVAIATIRTRRLNSILRAFLLAISFALLGGFVPCDMSAVGALSDRSY